MEGIEIVHKCIFQRKGEDKCFPEITRISLLNMLKVIYSEQIFVPYLSILIIFRGSEDNFPPSLFVFTVFTEQNTLNAMRIPIPNHRNTNKKKL